MALGTALSDAAVISTTAGVHDISFNAAGIATANEWTDNQDILYVCLMGYHLDYSNNAPVQDGDHTQIYLRFSEYTGTGSDPRLAIVNIRRLNVSILIRNYYNIFKANIIK